jgi:nitrate/TMAO reductase-like tetraheme cytochrome c subunit
MRFLSPETLLYFLIVVSVILCAVVAVKPSMGMQTTGRIFLFSALVVLPFAAGFAGLAEHMERSKRVEFCLSCHPMQDYGRSLHVDDLSHIAANHFLNGRIPKETACFACHTSYTLYGDYQAKLSGMRHVMIQYFGTVPKPEDIKLRTPYNNRECLHCHEGSRSFEEGATHHAEDGRLQAIKDNKVSCMTQDCHGTVHDVAHLDKFPQWPASEKKGETKVAKEDGT